MAEEIEINPIEEPSSDDKNIATITHLGGSVLFFIPSLVVWLLKRGDGGFVEQQAREALNFQVSVALAMFISGFLKVFIIGFLLIPVVLLANFVFSIFAAVATSKGEEHRYSFSLRLIN